MSVELATWMLDTLGHLAGHWRIGDRTNGIEMTHEPGCVELGNEWDSPKFCGVCATARAAYQRGREDAARAVEAVRHLPDCGEDESIFDYCECHRTSAYAAAARGDGEQA